MNDDECLFVDCCFCVRSSPMDSAKRPITRQPEPSFQLGCRSVDPVANLQRSLEIREEVFPEGCWGWRGLKRKVAQRAPRFLGRMLFAPLKQGSGFRAQGLGFRVSGLMYVHARAGVRAPRMGKHQSQLQLPRRPQASCNTAKPSAKPIPSGKLPHFALNRKSQISKFSKSASPALPPPRAMGGSASLRPQTGPGVSGSSRHLVGASEVKPQRCHRSQESACGCKLIRSLPTQYPLIKGCA